MSGLELLHGGQLRRLVISGARVLLEHEDAINNLNVFPVPDGDTGTNMHLTLKAAVHALEQTQNSSFSCAAVAETVADNTLRGARGNSGVILSQLFRGFALEVGDRQALAPAQFAAGLAGGVNAAYRAVMRPVEGTILTVAREASRAALHATSARIDYLTLMEAVCSAARNALEKTPDMLAVLREAGVVDAGGTGLLCIYEGYLLALKEILAGDEAVAQVEPGIFSAFFPATEMPVTSPKTGGLPSSANVTETDNVFGYCTELLLKGENLSPEELRRSLVPMGDSLLVVGDAALIKVHIHTLEPGEVLNRCAGLGSLHEIKIENMNDQHHDLLLAQDGAEKPEKFSPARPAIVLPAEKTTEIAVLAVSMGDGLERIFKSMGAAAVVSGGQTMNTSTDDFLQAIATLPQRKLLILPNNKNIILAARQTEALLPEHEVRVVPTRSIPEGLSALVQINRLERSLDRAAQRAEAAAEAVRSGQVTVAIRDAAVNGQIITAGDWLGMAGDELQVVGKSRDAVFLDLLEHMVQPSDEIIAVYYGVDIDETTAESLRLAVEQKFAGREIEFYAGGQPLYPFYIGIE